MMRYVKPKLGGFWFIIGLDFWIFPSEPKIGNLEALHEWEPIKAGIWRCLKLRWELKDWRYTINSEEFIPQ